MSHFVLVDCNNFFVSCERLFNPKLEELPVIVLSSNDGCVVARSQEAKKLGIKMGEPFFKIKDFCSHQRVQVFSSNFQLYADISKRVMDTLKDFSPDIQVYSIDEAFLTYPKEMMPQQIVEIGMEIKARVKKWVGIPVSIGIGPTKTLAKAANALAKQNRDVGIFDLSCEVQRAAILQDFPIEEVWGIGRRLSVKLRSKRIYTAWEFQQCDPIVIRNMLGVVGERMLWELRGVSCLPLEKRQPKKSMTYSRSFGKTVASQEDLEQALSTYVSRICTKLRQEERACANTMIVFLEALVDSASGLRQSYSLAVPFEFPTNDTSQMIAAAKLCLQQLYSAEHRYKKCGVILLDLEPESQVCPDLFAPGPSPKQQQATRLMDNVNTRFGKESLFLGAEGIDSANWRKRSEQKSTFNTTSWDSLPVIR